MCMGSIGALGTKANYSVRIVVLTRLIACLVTRLEHESKAMVVGIEVPVYCVTGIEPCGEASSCTHTPWLRSCGATFYGLLKCHGGPSLRKDMLSLWRETKMGDLSVRIRSQSSVSVAHAFRTSWSPSLSRREVMRLNANCEASAVAALRGRAQPSSILLPVE